MGLLDFFKRKTPQDRFVEEMQGRLTATGMFAELRYQPQTFSFSGTKPDGGRINIFLNNVYDDASRAQGEEREATIARAHVMPSVRTRMDTEVTRLLNQHHNVAALSPVAWPVAADVKTLLSYDGADSIVRLDADQVAKWGIGRDELYAQAIDNLRLRGPERFTTTAHGLHVSAWQDDYDNARILLPELLRRLPVTGELLAMAPSRNDLFLTGSEQG